MSDQNIDASEPEQVPNHHIIAELEQQLHLKTSELVVALARIRTRDERIVRLERDLAACRKHHAGGSGVEADAGG